MATLLNTLYLLATILFVCLVYIQTLRDPPLPDRRTNWPLRHFWPGDRFRHLALVFAGLSAVGMVVVVIGGAIEADRAAIPLALLGAAALTYSIVLYWRPSPPKTHGF